MKATPIKNATTGVVTCPGTGYTSVGVARTTSLKALESAAPIALGELAAGQGVCVRMEMTLKDLAASENNKTQGDLTAFDVRFDLAQAML